VKIFKKKKEKIRNAGAVAVIIIMRPI
jgi:hypothetical protein